MTVIHVFWLYVGGPGQMPHLAPTYAAVLSLCILGTEEAYNVIDRWAHFFLFTSLCHSLLYRTNLQLFLTQMHQSDGSFIMHTDGEVDVRYVCVLMLINVCGYII